MYIEIAINNDQGCPATGWDATPHHHNPTAKRTSLSNVCILVTLAHPAVHHNPTIWMIQTKSWFIWEQYSFPFSQTPPQMRTWPPRHNPGMVRPVTLAIWKCVTLMIIKLWKWQTCASGSPLLSSNSFRVSSVLPMEKIYNHVTLHEVFFSRDGGFVLDGNECRDWLHIDRYVLDHIRPLALYENSHDMF